MKDKMKELGIIFDIGHYWHKKVSMPRDSDNNESPWFDLYETKKKQNNKDAFEKIMKDITKCTEDTNDNIVKKGEIVCSEESKLFLFW